MSQMIFICLRTYLIYDNKQIILFTANTVYIKTKARKSYIFQADNNPCKNTACLGRHVIQRVYDFVACIIGFPLHSYTSDLNITISCSS